MPVWGELSSAGKKSCGAGGTEGKRQVGCATRAGSGCSNAVPRLRALSRRRPQDRTEPGRGEPGGAGAAPACWERGPLGGAARRRGPGRAEPRRCWEAHPAPLRPGRRGHDRQYPAAAGPAEEADGQQAPRRVSAPQGGCPRPGLRCIAPLLPVSRFRSGRRGSARGLCGAGVAAGQRLRERAGRGRRRTRTRTRRRRTGLAAADRLLLAPLPWHARRWEGSCRAAPRSRGCGRTRPALIAARHAERRRPARAHRWRPGRGSAGTERPRQSRELRDGPWERLCLGVVCGAGSGVCGAVTKVSG